MIKTKVPTLNYFTDLNKEKYMIKTKVTTTTTISIDEQHATHCIKNFYYNISEGSIWMLCHVDCSEVCLVSIASGNRYKNPIEVDDVFFISDSEFHVVCAGNSKDFKLLSSVDITASI